MLTLVFRVVFVGLCLWFCWDDVRLLFEARFGVVEPELSRGGAVLLTVRASVLALAAGLALLPGSWLFESRD